jgi:hypothetical protein
VSRMLGVAPTIADSIIEQLSKPCDKAVDAGEGRRQHSTRNGVWLFDCMTCATTVAGLATTASLAAYVLAQC